MPIQSEHTDFQKSTHNLDIQLICDHLKSPGNIGGVLRLADAFGASSVIFLSEEKSLSPKAKSVARGTQSFVSHNFIPFKDWKREEDREYFCLEITKNSLPLKGLLMKSSKIGVIIGNENHGVSELFLEQFPSFHIPMFGNNSSMNVATSLGVALYELTR